MYPPGLAPTFFEIAGGENFNDITLTIYYMDFFTLNPAPVRLEQLTGGWRDNKGQLIGGWYDHRIVVPGENLAENRDLIKQIVNAELVQVENGLFVNARLYYVFEHVAYGELFSFLAFGSGDTMFVNGLEVEYNSIFFEAVLPFLPDDAFETIERYINTMRQRPVHHRHP